MNKALFLETEHNGAGILTWENARTKLRWQLLADGCSVEHVQETCSAILGGNGKPAPSGSKVFVVEVGAALQHLGISCEHLRGSIVNPYGPPECTLDTLEEGSQQLKYLVATETLRDSPKDGEAPSFLSYSLVLPQATPSSMRLSLVLWKLGENLWFSWSSKAYWILRDPWHIAGFFRLKGLGGPGAEKIEARLLAAARASGIPLWSRVAAPGSYAFSSRSDRLAIGYPNGSYHDPHAHERGKYSPLCSHGISSRRTRQGADRPTRETLGYRQEQALGILKTLGNPGMTELELSGAIGIRPVNAKPLVDSLLRRKLIECRDETPRRVFLAL